MLLTNGGRQSLGQEVQGGVPLLHQLRCCGVHLGSGEVTDGESIDHFPGLVLQGVGGHEYVTTHT